MKTMPIIVIFILLAYLAMLMILPKYNYEQGFEAGKLYVRNCMLQQTDSILGCSRLGYIPDTISVKQELKNGGNYKFDKGNE